jgi:hypothetical protein
MLFHVYDDIEIPRGAVVEAGFSLSLNAQPGAVVHSCRDPYFEDFFSSDAASPLTGSARFADHSPRSVTLAAGPANGKEALLVTNLPRSVACGAGNRIFAFRGPASVAGAARILPRDLDLGLETESSLTERDLQVVAEIGAAFRTAASASSKDVAKPEKLPEDVAEISERSGIEAAESPLQPAVAETVVTRPFLGVAQDAVSLRSFFEAFLGVFVVRVFVRMIFESQFPIGALDLLVRGVLGNPQDFVVISLVVQRQSPLFRISSVLQIPVRI